MNESGPRFSEQEMRDLKKLCSALEQSIVYAKEGSPGQQAKAVPRDIAEKGSAVLSKLLRKPDLLLALRPKQKSSADSGSTTRWTRSGTMSLREDGVRIEKLGATSSWIAFDIKGDRLEKQGVRLEWTSDDPKFVEGRVDALFPISSATAEDTSEQLRDGSPESSHGLSGTHHENDEPTAEAKKHWWHRTPNVSMRDDGYRVQRCKGDWWVGFRWDGTSMHVQFNALEEGSLAAAERAVDALAPGSALWKAHTEHVTSPRLPTDAEIDEHLGGTCSPEEAQRRMDLAHDRLRLTQMVTMAAEIERLLLAAKSKVAIHVGSLEPPPSGRLPEWADEQLESAAAHPLALLPVIERTDRLIKAVQASSVAGRYVRIEAVGNGRLALKWIDAEPLQWIVRPCEFPWPGVDVEVLDENPAYPNILRSRLFYDAPSLIDDLERSDA